MREESVFQFTVVPPRAGVSGQTAAEAVAQLTLKERQVVDLVCRGMTNKETARELGGISPHTVATHLRRAYVKLNVNSRDQLSGLMSRIARPT